MIFTIIPNHKIIMVIFVGVLGKAAVLRNRSAARRANDAVFDQNGS